MKPTHNSPAGGCKFIVQNRTSDSDHYDASICRRTAGQPLLLRENAQAINISDKLKAFNINEILFLLKPQMTTEKHRILFCVLRWQILSFYKIICANLAIWVKYLLMNFSN